MKYILFLLLFACPTRNDCYPPNGRDDYTTYHQSPNFNSVVYRFQIDDQKSELNIKNLDATVKNVVDCVNDRWPTMTDDNKSTGWCTGTAVLDIKTCLIVQVPPDWYVSKCSGKEVFACSVPATSCLEKGLQPTSECPCVCRAIIQGTDTVVTAPNLELFPARLTELLTGCDQIWETPLASCGSPGLVVR